MKLPIYGLALLPSLLAANASFAVQAPAVQPPPCVVQVVEWHILGQDYFQVFIAPANAFNVINFPFGPQDDGTTITRDNAMIDADKKAFELSKQFNPPCTIERTVDPSEEEAIPLIPTALTQN